MSLTEKVLSEMPTVVAREARMSLSVGANPDAQKRLAFWTRYSRLVASQQVPKSSDSLHGRIALRW